jgi:hypothetical protein
MGWIGYSGRQTDQNGKPTFISTSCLDSIVALVLFYRIPFLDRFWFSSFTMEFTCCASDTPKELAQKEVVLP